MPTFTQGELKRLAWLLEVLVDDQQHFLADETDRGAIAEAAHVKRSGLAMLKRIERERQNKRTAIMWQFVELAVQLSPENLSGDGEFTTAQIQHVRDFLLRQWHMLEKHLGHRITEETVDRWRVRHRPRVSVRVVSTRDANGDSELRLVPDLARTKRMRGRP